MCMCFHVRKATAMGPDRELASRNAHGTTVTIPHCSVTQRGRARNYEVNMVFTAPQQEGMGVEREKSGLK